MRTRFVGILAAMALLLAFAAPVAADAPNACPDGAFKIDVGPETGKFTIGGTEVTYTITNGGKTISFSHPVDLCVKGGSAANSGFINDATSYNVNFVNGGGQNPAISNFVIYALGTPTTPVMTSLILDKVTVGGDASFAFAASNGFTTNLTGAAAAVVVASTPNSYTITETLTGTWTLTSVNCVGNVANPMESLSGTTVSVTVAAGETVTCTFTNTLTTAGGGGGNPGGSGTQGSTGGPTTAGTPVRGSVAGSTGGPAADGLPNTAVSASTQIAPAVILGIALLLAGASLATVSVSARRR